MDGSVPGFGLLHHAVDGKDPAVALADADHAVILDLVVGHGLDRDDVAAALGIGVEHLGQTAFAGGLHQHVGQQQGKRLVADQFAGAPHGVTEAQRLLLAGIAGGSGAGQVVVQNRELGGLAALGQHLFELELAVEMVLDHALVAAGDEDEVLDAGFHGLVDHMLN